MKNAAVFALLVGALVLVDRVAATTQREVNPFASVTWRNIGPATTGTRIVDLAVVEKDPRVFYAATAASGLWKNPNHG